MQILLCLFLLVPADPIDAAAHDLAAKIAAHLAPNERPHLVTRNISTLSANEATRARRMIEASLPKRPRAKTVVEVSLTFSETPAAYLWVAEIHNEVEMGTVTISRSPAPPARQLLTKRLLWQQNEPFLDFFQQPDRTIILSTTTVAVIQATHRSETPIDIPRVRDPRGHLEIDGNTLTAFFPGATCRGTVEPLHLDCEGTSSDFLLNGAKVHFTPARNTIEGIRPSAENVAVCNSMKLTALKDNTVGVLNKNDTPLDQADLPGIITALWPTADGATVVVHNLNTEQYAAFSLSVDCGSH